MNINPGKFNKRIKIIDITESKDSDGFPEKTEEIILNTFASINNTTGSTMIKSNASFENANTRFLIRTPKVEIKTKYKIKYKEYYYTIDFINNYNEENHYTEIIGKRTDLNG